MTAAKDRVTEAALRLFARQGSSGVSMRDLARELGIRAPSIYSHFPSKEALLVSTVTPMLDQLDALLAQGPAQPVSKEARRAWLLRYLDFLSENQVTVRFSMVDAGVQTHPELKARLFGQHTRIRELLESFGVRSERQTLSVEGMLCWPSFWHYRLTDTDKARIIDDIELIIDTHEGDDTRAGDPQTENDAANSLP
jgi:AcrR family transcriptional regulator